VGSEQNSSIAFEESANRLLQEIEAAKSREIVEKSSDEEETLQRPKKMVARRLFVTDSEDEIDSVSILTQSKQQKMDKNQTAVSIDSLESNEELALQMQPKRPMESRHRGKTFHSSNAYIT